MKIKLVMDRERAILLMRACEVISRVGMQQFKEMVELLNPEISYGDAIEIEGWLKSKLGNLPYNAYHGIHSDVIPEECQVAWDAYQHLRREISWELLGLDWRRDKRDWKKMIQVCYDEPFKASKLDGNFETERIDAYEKH